MKNVLCLFVLCLAALAGRTQNLVRNPGFETYDSCPDKYSQINRVPPWISPTLSTPDYFNKCGVSSVGVPFNLSGYQPAHSGNAYAAIIMWHQNYVSREYIEGPLNSALIKGRDYHFEMFVNLANSSKYSTKSIGAYFSDTLVSGIPSLGLLPFTPQIQYAGSTGFDTAGWRLVSGDFIATGKEKYVIIGNFKSDSLTDKFAPNNTTSYEIYCLIDDISLEEKVGTGVTGMPVAIPAIGPNPFSDKIFIKVASNATYELRLTNMESQVVMQRHFNASFELNTGQLPAGLYFYQITGREGIVARDRIIKL